MSSRALGRPDRAEQELAEMRALQEYLRQQFSIDEIDALVSQAVEQTGAT